MSILYYISNNKPIHEPMRIDDERYMRSALDDLKQGLDLIFDLKSKIDLLHPVAAETLIRLLSH